MDLTVSLLQVNFVSIAVLQPETLSILDITRSCSLCSESAQLRMGQFQLPACREQVQ